MEFARIAFKPEWRTPNPCVDRFFSCLSRSLNDIQRSSVFLEKPNQTNNQTLWCIRSRMHIFTANKQVGDIYDFLYPLVHTLCLRFLKRHVHLQRLLLWFVPCFSMNWKEVNNTIFLYKLNSLPHHSSISCKPEIAKTKSMQHWVQPNQNFRVINCCSVGGAGDTGPLPFSSSLQCLSGWGQARSPPPWAKSPGPGRCSRTPAWMTTRRTVPPASGEPLSTHRKKWTISNFVLRTVDKLV